MQNKEDQFLQMYGAMFGPLNAASGKDYILAWVSEERTSLPVLEKVLEKLSRQLDEGKFTTKPKLATIKKVYSEMVGRHRNDAEGESAPDCGMCMNSGKVHVAYGGNNAGTAQPMTRRPHWWPYMAVSMIPCTCQRGYAANQALDPPYPLERLKMLHSDCAYAYGALADGFLDECRKLRPDPIDAVAPLAGAVAQIVPPIDECPF